MSFKGVMCVIVRYTSTDQCVLLMNSPYLFSRYTWQGRSAGHLTTAIITAGRLSQRNTAGPSPGSDDGNFLLRVRNPAGRLPRWVIVIKTKRQQRAGDPRYTRQHRPEGRRQAAEAGEGQQPHQAGEDQDQDAVLKFESGDESKQTHAAQHKQQPAHHLHLLVLLSPLQQAQDHQIPQVA